MHKWRDPTPEDRRLPRSSDEVAELQRHAEIHPPHVGNLYSSPSIPTSHPPSKTSSVKSKVARRILELLGSFSLFATVAGVVTTNVLVILDSRTKTDEIKVLRGQLEAFEQKVHSLEELNTTLAQFSDKVTKLSANADLLLEAAKESKTEMAGIRRDPARPPRKYTGRVSPSASASPASPSPAPAALPGAEDSSPASVKQPTPAAADVPSPREASGPPPAVPGAKDSAADSAMESTPAPLGGPPSKEAPPSPAQADNG